MITADPTKGLPQPRWVEYAHLTARGAQWSPKGAAQLTEATEPVGHHGDHDSGLSTLHQRIAKRAADFVISDDVIFQQHAPLCAADLLQPRIKVCWGVDQQLQGITAQQRCTGGAAQGLLGQQAKWFHVRLSCRRHVASVCHPALGIAPWMAAAAVHAIAMTLVTFGLRS